MSVDDGARLEVAIRLARQAGDAIMEIARRGPKAGRKDDGTWVTDADHRSDDIIRAGLTEAFPDDAILSEESGLSRADEAAPVWVVDPLDGTKAFVKGIPGFSVMIGLLRDERPVLGVVWDPVDEWLYYATEGNGACMVPPGEKDPVPAHVRGGLEPSEMTLVSSPGLRDEQRQAIQRELGFRKLTQVNSVGIKVGLMVRQEADVYYSRHGVSYWDTVAPLMIAREAGAEASLVAGGPLAYDLSGDALEHPGTVVFAPASELARIRQGFHAATSGDRPDGRD